MVYKARNVDKKLDVFTKRLGNLPKKWVNFDEKNLHQHKTILKRNNIDSLVVQKFFINYYQDMIFVLACTD